MRLSATWSKRRCRWKAASPSSCRMASCSGAPPRAKSVRSFIEENLLDAVIGLPANLFFGTGIPAAILVFDRSREPGGANAGRADVLFVDGSRGFQAGKNGNVLRPEDIAEIADAYHQRAEIARYSRPVPVAEIAANDYNLNIARYIDTFEAQEAVDIAALQQEIAHSGNRSRRRPRQTRHPSS